jgi:phosphate transport system protein
MYGAMVELTHLEEMIERDLQIIRNHLQKMAKLVLKQLEDAVSAFTEANRSLAYTVVLKDHRIDVLEDRIDRLCQEFLVRHMPVSEQLRFVVAVFKVNSELERIGDYAEAIARRAAKIKDAAAIPERESILEMSGLAIKMLSSAMDSFLALDADSAMRTLESDRRVDQMNSALFESMTKNGNVHKDLNVRFSLLGVISRIERVADRACNIAEDAVYVARGQVMRHFPRSDTRVLFISEQNACRSQMAEGIARKLAPVHFFFSSAGSNPTQTDSRRTIEFMARQGIDISRLRIKRIEDAGKLEDFNVVVTLSHKAVEACPVIPYQVVQLNWDVQDPSQITGSEEEIEKAYREVFDKLCSRIKDLTQGLLGAEDDEECK